MPKLLGGNKITCGCVDVHVRPPTESSRLRFNQKEGFIIYYLYSFWISKIFCTHWSKNNNVENEWTVAHCTVWMPSMSRRTCFSTWSSQESFRSHRSTIAERISAYSGILSCSRECRKHSATARRIPQNCLVWHFGSLLTKFAHCRKLSSLACLFLILVGTATALVRLLPLIVVTSPADRVFFNISVEVFCLRISVITALATSCFVTTSSLLWNLASFAKRILPSLVWKKSSILFVASANTLHPVDHRFGEKLVAEQPLIIWPSERTRLQRVIFNPPCLLRLVCESDSMSCRGRLQIITFV